MKYRWTKVLGILAIAPVLLGAGWLITTHSGDDVLLYDDHAKSLQVHVSPGSGGLSGARGLTFGPDGDLFVCSAGKFNWAILRYRHTGQFKNSFASGGGLVHPYQGIFGPDGQFYVSGQDNDGVVWFDGKTGKAKGSFVIPGTGGLQSIRGIAFHPDGDLLAAGRDNNAILRYNGKTGQFKGFFVPAKRGKLDRPIQLHYGPDGYLYVGSSGNNRVLRFDGRTGQFLDTFVKHKAGGLKRPSGFAWGPKNDLYVASRESNQILRYDGTTGKFKEVVLDHKHDKRLRNPEFLLRAGP